MNVTQDKSVGAAGDRRRLVSSASPGVGDSVEGEVEIVGVPIDLGVDFGEPWFPKNNVVFAKVIDDGVEGVRVVESLKVDSRSVGRDRGGAIGEEHWDWGRW